ncbi:hypothetical protein mRhiFer1_010006 [Rhinolophus ferrumequinum]|uniref:Uncharacterized protein n=1 Tax=Rhinolophus ferrumequinum TaxID=59479 RepID=A0A7J7Y556_RHIFE|nr:hypothetical protein mRhiFer1_010006 [Rhinolophus ferrumequinum]
MVSHLGSSDLQGSSSGAIGRSAQNSAVMMTASSSGSESPRDTNGHIKRSVGSYHTKASFAPPSPNLFFFVNDIPHNEHSKRIAIASLSSLVLSVLNAGSCFAISKVSLKPWITAGASIRSSHREEAGSGSSTSSVEDTSSPPQHTVEYTFHFISEKDCISHRSFLTKNINNGPAS